MLVKCEKYVLSSNLATFFTENSSKLLSQEALFGSSCTTSRLVDGPCPVPLVELTAFPEPLSYRRRGKGRKSRDGI